jgi:hypothetical protein
MQRQIGTDEKKQNRASTTKKTPDRRGQKETEKLAELVVLELRRDSRQTVKTDTERGDAGRQLKQEVK